MDTPGSAVLQIPVFLAKEYHQLLVVPKSFSYAQSRRSGLPPSDEGGGTA